MDDVPAGAVVRVPDEAEWLRLGGFDVRYLAESSETGGAFSLMATREPEPVAGPPLHIHHDTAESFVVLAGEYVVHLDGRESRCPTGSFVYIPVGMPHTFRVTAPGSSKLNLYTPAAMEGYFRELAEAITGGADEAALDRIAERYSMEVVGPVPDGYL